MRHLKLSAFSGLVWLGLCIGCSSTGQKPKIDEEDSNTTSKHINAPKSNIHHIDTTSVSDSTSLAVRPNIERPTQNAPSQPKIRPRRIYDRLTQRIVDSLNVTPGALAALHPEDRALAEGFWGMRKVLLPLKDPKTGKPLPFPYAYPSRYGADIRRLDSIKNAQQADSTGRD